MWFSACCGVLLRHASFFLAGAGQPQVYRQRNRSGLQVHAWCQETARAMQDAVSPVVQTGFGSVVSSAVQSRASKRLRKQLLRLLQDLLAQR